MKRYRVTCESLETGRQEVFETNDVLMSHTHESEAGTSWHFIFHVRESVVTPLLAKIDMKAVLGKLDMNGLIGKVIMSRFGGGK